MPRARAAPAFARALALTLASLALVAAFGSAGCRRRRSRRSRAAAVASAGPVFRLPARPASGGPATVAAGYQHSCGLSGAGEVFCWGADGFLQLGAPDPVGREPAGLVRVRGLRDALGVAAGEYHSCAVSRAGAVFCWGDNRDGQLGESSPERSSEPVRAGVLSDAVQVSAGPYATCAVRRNGGVVCWGRDSLCGRAVVPGGEDVSPPVAVAGVVDAARVAVGRFHACALSRGGGVSCWGSNEYGALGGGEGAAGSSVFDRLQPGPVAGVADAVDLATRADHTCVVRRGGAVACWGDNEAGQLGRGEARPLAPRARRVGQGVGGGADAGARDAGLRAARVRDAGGDATASSSSAVEEDAGPGELLESAAVADVPGVSNAVRVVTGQWHTCALRSDGRVLCWGNNELGQLGVHAPRPGSVAPVEVQGLDDAVDLAAGQRHTCARRRGGAVVCWGENLNGQLGTRAVRWSSRPVAVGAAVSGEISQEPEEPAAGDEE